MAQPYVGEIRMFAGNFAPAGWQFCEGQFLPISENDTLFQLIGTTYGGDGVSTFALPDLRGRIPIHQGGGFTLAATGGVEAVTLTQQQIPSHTHGLLAVSSPGYLASPAGAAVAKHRDHKAFTSASVSTVAMSVQMVGATGGSQPHNNMPPYLVLSFAIALQGIFPPRN